MNLEVNELDLRFRQGLVGLTVLFGLIRVVLPEENAWVYSIFLILMAGNVGYFTNFLAIKMLFQPKQGKVLGWEGLVPKNKPQIARSLAESVQTQLLSPDIILEYIHDNNLVETGAQKLSDWTERLLNKREIRDQITTRLVDLLKEHGDEVVEALFDQAEKALGELASDPERIRELWGRMREHLAEYVSDQANRERLSAIFRSLMLEEVPRLAGMIDSAMEQYLRDRETVGRIGMGLKRMFSIDQEAIQEALESFVNDPDSAEQFMGVMDTLVDQVLADLASEKTQDLVVARVQASFDTVAEYARANLLPLTASRLQAYLDDERSWEQFDALVLKSIRALKDSFTEMMASEQGTENIKKFIGQAVRRLNVTDLVEEQVMKLDTDELEDLILNNTGGNLVVIQILGGSLGLVAGFVQVDIRFAVPLLAFMGVVYLAWMHNRRKYS